MTLAEFFRTIEPLFAERASAAEVARSLYGDDVGVDGRRLEVYERGCRWRRAETLGGVFPRVKRWFVEARGCAHGAPDHERGEGPEREHEHRDEHGDHDRRAGERAWAELANDYFVEAPWTAIKPLPNTGGFPAFLARVAGSRGLPAWLPELADVEWWFTTTRAAPDEPDDADRGPLRLASTVELRPLDHDLVTWVEDFDAFKEGPPARRATVVLFWRNRDLFACVRAVSPRQMRLLAAVRAGRSIDPVLAAELGLAHGDLVEVVRAFHAAGVLVGARPADAAAPAPPLPADPAPATRVK